MAEKDRFRKNCLRVKVSDEELQIAKDKAEYCNLSMSDFLRKQIVDGVIIKYDRIDMKTLANEMNKIGVNINQIAKRINEKGVEYDRQDLDDLIKEFQELQALVYSTILGME